MRGKLQETGGRGCQDTHTTMASRTARVFSQDELRLPVADGLGRKWLVTPPIGQQAADVNA